VRLSSCRNREFAQGGLGVRKIRLFSVNLKVLDTQGGSETWKKCKIGLFRPEEIRSLQNNKSAAAQHSFYILLKGPTDDNVRHSVVDYHLFYSSQYG